MRFQRFLPVLVVVGSLVTGARAADAQGNVPVRTLSKPVAEFDEPFTAINGLRELGDGRVIVSDARDRVVQLLDFKSGKASKVGREGQGPGEYSMPAGVFAAPRDTTLLFDPLNQRVLVIGPDGKSSGMHSLRREESGPGPRIGGMASPRFSDAMGRLYSQGMGIAMTPEGPRTADTVPITRYHRGSGRTDTVAFVRPPKNNASVSGSSGNMQMRIGMANPFAPRDEWAVGPDGRIAIVHPEPYRVEWIAPNGQRTRGPAIPVARQRVTEADKKEIERQRASSSVAMSMTREETGRGAPRVEARAVDPSRLPPITDWPETKPPFTANAARIAPNGELWVQRTVPAGEAPLFDVFDAQGRLRAQVKLPKGTRLLGFGKGAAYLVRTDADDLQYLQKYAL